jgi:uncharacterized protein (TIRG00374 family)
MAKRTVRIAVSLVLMVALLVLFLWNVDFKEVGRALESASLGWLLLAGCLALLSYWLRAIRIILLLRPVGKVRHSTANLSTAVGYAAMSLLPARMGDLVRPVIISRRDRLPLSAALASILTERLFDMWTIIVGFLMFSLAPPTMNLSSEALHILDLLELSGWILGLGVVAGSLVLLGLFRYQERFVHLLTWPARRFVPRWEEGVKAFFNHFLEGLKVIQRPRDLLLTLGASILVWWTIYFQMKLTLLAFGVVLPLRASYLLVMLSVAGLAIPTPGGAGGFHWAIQKGLTAFFGVELNLATGIAIAYHALCFVPITIVGLLCLPVLGLSLRETARLAEETSVEPVEPGEQKEG